MAKPADLALGIVAAASADALDSGFQAHLAVQKIEQLLVSQRLPGFATDGRCEVVQRSHFLDQSIGQHPFNAGANPRIEIRSWQLKPKRFWRRLGPGISICPLCLPRAD